jgi:formylglycine-generating enzyme required for sulfatase activity
MRKLSYFFLFSAIVLCILSADAQAEELQNEIKPGTIKTIDLGGSVIIDFVWCPPGNFMMGSTKAQQDSAVKAFPSDLEPETRNSTITAIQNEGPQHKVILSKGFWMARTEVTQAQWKQVMGNNTSKFIEQGLNAPVETVSWNDCHVFIKKMNRVLEKKKAGRMRLPTEAEWEYACRAGSTAAYYFGDDASSLGDYAWFAGNSGMKSQSVGQKKPNAWGLYDMHGNVWEWCSSWFGKYDSEDSTDPKGPILGSGRVGRGGGWDDFASDLRSAYRSFGRPPGFKASPLGFRPVIIPLRIQAAPLSSASECSSTYENVCLRRFLLDSSVSS